MSRLIDHFQYWVNKLAMAITFSGEEKSATQIDWQDIEQMRGRLTKMRAKSQASVHPVSDTYMTDKHRENTNIVGLRPTLRNNDDRSGVSRWTGEQAMPLEAQLRDSIYRDHAS